MFCGAGNEETQSLITIFLLPVPTTFYIMGLMEGKWAEYCFLPGLFFHLVSIAHRAMTVGGVLPSLGGLGFIYSRSSAESSSFQR